MLRFLFLGLMVKFSAPDNRTTEHNPKEDVELIPEAIENEKRQIHLFFIMMFQVCKDLCIWPKFCEKFCDIFQPRDDDDDTSQEEENVRNPKLFHVISDICSARIACLENCSDLDLMPKARARNSTQFLREFYGTCNNYVRECAARNGKGLKTLGAGPFCKQIAKGDARHERTCLNTLLVK